MKKNLSYAIEYAQICFWLGEIRRVVNLRKLLEKWKCMYELVEKKGKKGSSKSEHFSKAVDLFIKSVDTKCKIIYNKSRKMRFLSY